MELGFKLNIFHRLRLVKVTVAIGMLLSVCCCPNLWAGQRWFPVCPVFDALYVQPPYDYIFLVLEIVLLLALIISSKPRLLIFLILILNLSLILLDQNRLQPWFYLYNCILFVLLFYNWRIDNINNYHSFFIILQLCVSAVYVYSGLQKINPNFVDDTFKWFIKPLSAFFSDRQMQTIVKVGYAVPYIEVFLGLGLLIKPLRFIAVPVAIIMHILIVFLMSPFGNNYNMVIWPWNLIMVVLILLLFSGTTTERFFSITHLFKIPVFYLVMALFWVLPAVNLRNHWETYLSFSLYSGNTHNAKILLSDDAYRKLPFYLRHFVYWEGGEYMLYPKLWCLTELKTPLYPEKRIFEKTTSFVKVLTNCTDKDVKLVYIEKLKIFEQEQ